MQPPTNDPSDFRTRSAHVEAALEAGCDALIALQLMYVAGADGLSGAEGRATEAITSVWRAIAELRAAQALQGSRIYPGFVVAASHPSDGEIEALRGQSKPRRTA